MAMNLMSGVISSTSNNDTTRQVSDTQCINLHLHSRPDSSFLSQIYNIHIALLPWPTSSLESDFGESLSRLLQRLAWLYFVLRYETTCTNPNKFSPFNGVIYK